MVVVSKTLLLLRPRSHTCCSLRNRLPGRTHRRRQGSRHQARACHCKVFASQAGEQNLQDTHGWSRCPMDQLVWQAGRLQRHGHRPPRAVSRGPLPHVQQALFTQDHSHARGSIGESTIHVFQAAFPAFAVHHSHEACPGYWQRASPSSGACVAIVYPNLIPSVRTILTRSTPSCSPRPGSSARTSPFSALVVCHKGGGHHPRSRRGFSPSVAPVSAFRVRTWL